jgi:hypothetical protein
MNDFPPPEPAQFNPQPNPSVNPCDYPFSLYSPSMQRYSPPPMHQNYNHATQQCLSQPMFMNANPAYPERSFCEIVSTFPCLAWYFFVSVFIDLIFDLVFACIDFSPYHLIDFFFQSILLLFLSYFVYRVIVYKDNSGSYCRNTVAALYFIECLIVILHAFVQVEASLVYAFFLIVLVNAIIVVITHFFLVNQQLSTSDQTPISQCSIPISSSINA